MFRHIANTRVCVHFWASHSYQLCQTMICLFLTAGLESTAVAISLLLSLNILRQSALKRALTWEIYTIEVKHTKISYDTYK